MKPLVSFCLKSYNGRRFLREALEGAFAQTYRPLEIVVSDDASTDGSWEEILDFLSGHPEPPGVEVRVSRNPANLGSVGNWDRLCEMARGELLVKADGDDVSVPERTSRIVDAWIADGKRATVVCHSGWLIGTRGQRLGKLRRVTCGWPLGAAMAFSRHVFETFGRAADGRLVDDAVYARRALLLGPELDIPDRLVRYRLGSGMTSGEWHVRACVTLCLRADLAAIEAVRTELEDLKARADGAVAGYEDGKARLDREWKWFKGKEALVTAKTFAERLAGNRAMGGWNVFSVFGFQRLAYLLPRAPGDALLFLYALARNLLRRSGLV